MVGLFVALGCSSEEGDRASKNRMLLPAGWSGNARLWETAWLVGDDGSFTCGKMWLANLCDCWSSARLVGVVGRQVLRLWFVVVLARGLAWSSPTEGDRCGAGKLDGGVVVVALNGGEKELVKVVGGRSPWLRGVGDR
jgi:hypothetical protein